MNPILIEFYFYKTIPAYPSYDWNLDKYQKVYGRDAFHIDFNNEIFNTFKRPIGVFFKENNIGKFFESPAMQLDDEKIAFHAEFDNVLFFYLYGSIRSFLKEFADRLGDAFVIYKDADGNYSIPIYDYNEKYTFLKQIPSVFEVFKFLIETRTNTIEKIDDNVFINIRRIKDLEGHYLKYNFS